MLQIEKCIGDILAQVSQIEYFIQVVIIGTNRFLLLVIMKHLP